MSGAGIRATKPVSITPRQFVSTVEGGASVAHTAYMGWSKPSRVVHHELGHANRQKTELTATAICGPVAKGTGRGRRQGQLPTYADKGKPNVTLHLPKENVIRGGTSLSKNSPTVIKMDRSFRHTFFGSHDSSPYSTPRSVMQDESPRRRPVPRHFTNHPIAEHMTQSPRQTRQAMTINSARSETAWIGDSAPRVQLHETAVESPRMQRLLDDHPNIDLDHKPARLPCSLQRQAATLGPYKAAVMPYNPEFLWVNTDPTYRYRLACPLSPRSRKLNGDPPLIPPLRHEKTWSKDAVSRTRDIYSKQMGNPRVLKLECSQNGFFDPSVISNDRAEHLFKEREQARKEGMDKLMEEGRREFASLKAQEQKRMFEEQFEREREAAEAAIIVAAAANLPAADSDQADPAEAAAGDVSVVAAADSAATGDNPAGASCAGSPAAPGAAADADAAPPPASASGPGS